MVYRLHHGHATTTHGRCILLRTLCRCGVVLVMLLIVLSAACTSHEAKVPQPESPESFPEVAHITFTGNTHFSSREIRQVMATKQRQLFPPWKHG